MGKIKGYQCDICENLCGESNVLLLKGKFLTEDRKRPFNVDFTLCPECQIKIKYLLSTLDAKECYDKLFNKNNPVGFSEEN